ncbi:sensor histidine kinase [Gracilibacillus alcaliphilus]|uniref:sensor histidine kinase n=1 Tax=Gracilibacillus alcaliphilus TaxID=1401441 RepID=UPI00195B51DC|nr:histidine kinase N-terminal 7TM domain-containing protein [Gracilibacillus alcaliphilus]MBM7675356.1 PAS domain S-box-containing protein [Gracilibacillus alcaliphilus]
MNYILYLTLIVSAMMMCLLLIYSFLHLQQRAVRYFAWAMVCRVIFGCSVIMELYSDELSMKLFFRQIEQTALVMNIPLIIMCALDLYGRDKWLKWQRQFVLFLPFMGWTALIWTNNKTHAVFESAILVDGYLEVSRTNLAFGFISICYCILLTCVYFIMTYFRKARPEIRKPGIMVIVLASIPAIVELIKLAYPNLSEWLLPLSVYCGVGGLIILWVVYRNKLFAIVPMARDFIVDTVREGMLTVDQKGIIIDCNPFIQPLFEKNGTSIIGKDIAELLREWPEWQTACRLKQEAAVEIKSEINGEEKYFMTKVYPLYSKRDRVLGTVSILFDITEKQQRLEEIAHLNFMKDQLFTLVSHDIREPIATQVSLIEMLEEEKRTFTPENAELVDFLSVQIRSTYMTVNNVLEWFRGQKNDVSLHPESIALFDLIYEAYRILFIKSKEKHINIDIHVDEAIYVYADREAIIMVLRNLLSNAIKFSERKAMVEILAEKDQEDKVMITVRDQGIGMTEERIRRLWKEESLTSTLGTEGEKGTGLGLQVSQQFVKMSGSVLSVESELGKGSAFYFSLKEGEKS